MRRMLRIGTTTMSDDKITIVMPEASDDHISSGLRSLTKILEKHTGRDNVQGILGGRHGYGVDYKNDVFEMHPFYWGECICSHDELQDNFYETLQHEQHCYQTELKNALIAEGYKLNEWGGPADELDEEEHFAGRERLSKFYSFKSAKAKELSAKYGFDTEVGVYVHCNCEYDVQDKAWHEENTHTEECPVDKPNFQHYESGFEVRWYKYIGRGMELNKNLNAAEWPLILLECANSVFADSAKV